MSGKNGRITAYINKKAIAANFQNMKANLKDGVKMVAVIKTDGYGFVVVDTDKITDGPLMPGSTIRAEGIEVSWVLIFANEHSGRRAAHVDAHEEE